jgi:hypothetical protein
MAGNGAKETHRPTRWCGAGEDTQSPGPARWFPKGWREALWSFPGAKAWCGFPKAAHAFRLPVQRGMTAGQGGSREGQERHLLSAMKRRTFHGATRLNAEGAPRAGRDATGGAQRASLAKIAVLHRTSCDQSNVGFVAVIRVMRATLRMGCACPEKGSENQINQTSVWKVALPVWPHALAGWRYPGGSPF